MKPLRKAGNVDVRSDKGVDLPAVDYHPARAVRAQLDVRGVHRPSDWIPPATEPGYHPGLVSQRQLASDHAGDGSPGGAGSVHDGIDVMALTVGQNNSGDSTTLHDDVRERPSKMDAGAIANHIIHQPADQATDIDPPLAREDRDGRVFGGKADVGLRSRPTSSAGQYSA